MTQKAQSCVFNSTNELFNRCVRFPDAFSFISVFWKIHKHQRNVHVFPIDFSNRIIQSLPFPTSPYISPQNSQYTKGGQTSVTRRKCRRTHLIETPHPTVRHLYLNDRAIVATIFRERSGTRGIRYHGRLVVSFLQLICSFLFIILRFIPVLLCFVFCVFFSWRCLAGIFKSETRVVFSDIGASLGFRMPNQNHKA